MGSTSFYGYSDHTNKPNVTVIIMLLLLVLAIDSSLQCSPLLGSQPSPTLPLASSSTSNQANTQPTMQDYDTNTNEIVSSGVQRDEVLSHKEEKSRLHPTLFDLFRPLVFNSSPIRAKANPKVPRNIEISTIFSPPVHWTYCDPICGVGDQAVDAENAKDNAVEDVLEAITKTTESNLIEFVSSSIRLKYNPASVLTEDFGPYFDAEGFRYRISGRTVPFKIHRDTPGLVESFTMPIDIRFTTITPLTPDEAKKLERNRLALGHHDMDVVADSSQLTVRCKGLMNFIRRAFSLRDKRTKPQEETELTALSAEIKRHVSSLSGSDVASTSRESVIGPPEAPSVYEDPFVAVTADGVIHVKNYYHYNPKAEFYMNEVHGKYNNSFSRRIHISDIKVIHFANAEDRLDNQLCKPWGITRNDVWWASHLNRMEGPQGLVCAVLDIGDTIRAGFSIGNFQAFTDCLFFLGMNDDVEFKMRLPTPPIHLIQIPFIDEDTTGENSMILKATESFRTS